jgi:broad specificity phosphatase PhoE
LANHNNNAVLMITIFLARHASPDWSRKDLAYHIPPGPPLTSQGITEAVALGGFMRLEGVRQLYVSPLERCLQTAGIIAGLIGAPWFIFPGLIEIQPGETSEDIQARLWPVFNQACKSAAERGPVALITHGSPIATLLSLLGLDQVILQNHQTYDNHNLLPPGGAWRARQAAFDDPWDLDLVFPSMP